VVSDNDTGPNTANNTGSGPEDEKKSAETPSAESAGSRPEIHEPKTDANRDEPGNGDKHWLDYATGVFAFIAAIGAILAAIFSGWQAWIASDTERRQLRAYVSFSTTNPIKMTSSEVTMVIDNFGETPAKDVQIWSSWEFVPFGQDLPADFQFLVKPPCGGTAVDQKMLPGPITIFPKNSYSTYGFHCPFDLVDLTRAERNEVSAFTYGFISYFDVFDEKHRTNFCYLWYPAIKKALFCNRHNEVDPKVYYQ
jgi:hypothetical protein